MEIRITELIFGGVAASFGLTQVTMWRLGSLCQLGKWWMLGTGFDVNVKPDSVVVRMRQAWKAFYLLEHMVLCAISLGK